MILLLNRQDLLAKKIKDGFTMEAYFREYYGNRSPPEESGKNTSLSIVVSLLSSNKIAIAYCITFYLF